MKNTRVDQHKIVFPLVAQQTDSHCGPATLQMLFAFLNKEFTQDQVVAAARVRSRLKVSGMRPDHLACAVAFLTPELQFWFKQKASVVDLETLVKKYHWPVGVNWQGLFYDNPADEKRHRYQNGEYGHYSIVTDVNVAEDTIVIADPYSEYFSKPRTFSLKWFVERWWDADIHVSKGVRDEIYTHHFMFMITPRDKKFPSGVGMLPPENLDVLQKKQGLSRFVPAARNAFKNWF